jgi:phage-related protein
MGRTEAHSGARLGEVTYVLHAFQKEARYGIATPQRELTVAEGLPVAKALPRKA